jgi:hypothetical protein
MTTGHSRARILLAAAAVSLAALAGPAVAAAALKPLPVVDLFTDDRVEDVTAAASPLGDAVVGWTGQNNPPATVLAAFRPGDGPFSPVEFLSTTANGERPGFVFQPDGTVLAVWSHATSTAKGGYATRPRTGSFGPAQSLPSGERFAKVGINATGTALAVWKSFVAGGNDVVVASRRAPGGVFEPPVTLSSPVDDNFILPQVAVNAPGEAIVAWKRAAGPNASTVEARIGSVAAPAFGPLQPLATESAADVSLSTPVVAIAPNGEGLAVWTRTSGGSSDLEFAVRPPGAASFMPATTLAPGASGAQVGFGPSGEAIIAFVRGPAGSRVPSAIVRPPGGAPGAIAPLGPAGDSAGIVSVGFDAAGAGLVAWSRSIDADTRLAEAARRPAGGSFGPLVEIANMGTGSSLAVAAELDGDALAAWRVTLAPGTVVLRVGGLDNVPDAPGGTPGGGERVTCNGARATLVGTANADRLRGTGQRDVIAGLGGDDAIRGLRGNDVVCGGAGRDRMLGGRGGDLLRGDAGRDRLLGGRGADLLRGGAGRDRLRGGPGRDRLRGGPGRDLLRGGAGRDSVRQ